MILSRIGSHFKVGSALEVVISGLQPNSPQLPKEGEMMALLDEDAARLWAALFQRNVSQSPGMRTVQKVSSQESARR